MKKIIIWSAGIVLLVLVLGLLIGGWILHEPRPKATPGPEADALAREMLDALNKEAWDSTRYLSWTFRGVNEYIWDREANTVQVSSGDEQVVIHTKSLEYKVLSPAEKEDDYAYFEKAWANFCNDSYWLCAPYKVFDEGTSRAIVPDASGAAQLLVTYESGGVTPGDSYLWQLDEQKRPKSFQMWVKIIPIGGLKASWGDWQELESGALIAQQRQLMDRIDIPVSNIKGGANWEDIGLTKDPFANMTFH